MDRETRIADVTGQQSASQLAADLAQRQLGSISRSQLRGLGFSEARIRSWLGADRLFPRYPGVYAWGRLDLSAGGELGAALLYAGHGAALAGITALWWQGLLNSRPDLIHVDAPGRRASRQDISIRHPVEIRREWHRDLPVVPLPTALLTATHALGHNSLRLVLARAEFQHLLSLPSLNATLAKAGRGTKALRKAMNAHLPQLAHCTNDFERDFVLLCERFCLPLPEPNARVGRFRPDMLWREAKLIVELDGKDAHSTAAQLASDGARQIFLESLGFTIVRYSWEQVHMRPEVVAREVRQLLQCHS